MRYERAAYRKFVNDMETAGIEWQDYGGRNFYHGPAAATDEDGYPSVQDVIRATGVTVNWDDLGLNFIVYPTRSIEEVRLDELEARATRFIEEEL